MVKNLMITSKKKVHKIIMMCVQIVTDIITLVINAILLNVHYVKAIILISTAVCFKQTTKIGKVI